MRISKNDYLLCVEDKQEFLARAMEDSTGDTSCYLEKNCHLPKQRTTLTVPKKQIILNLGTSPRPGKIYGLDTTNLFYTKKDHDDFGVINFFYKPDKQIVKDLWDSMAKVAKILKKHGLSFLLDDPIFEVLRYHKEKYAGEYMHAKSDKVPPRIRIRPEIMPASEYVYVWLHELGHHLHLGGFLTSKKLNAHWIRVFNTSIKVETIKKETSVKLLDQMLEQEDLPSDFKGQLSEDDALAFKWIIRTMSTNNALSIKELDTLFEADMKDDIRKLWPTRTITHKELTPVLTEYATKSHKETFAEAFALHLSGKKIPEGLVRLLEKSISYAKANKE